MAKINVRLFPTNGHPHTLGTTFRSSDTIENPIVHSEYNSEYDLVFSEFDIYSVGSSQYLIVDKDITADYGIVFLCDTTAYQKGKVPEKICATTAGNTLNSLNITTKSPRGVEAFINHWGEDT